jgi:hypothetical protein
VSRGLPAKVHSVSPPWAAGSRISRGKGHLSTARSRGCDASGLRFRSHTKITPQHYIATSQSGQSYTHIAMSLAGSLALHIVNIQPIPEPQQQQTTPTPSDDATFPSDMPAPPAYHMVVDPTAAAPSMNCPYESEDETEKDGDVTPEITINTATQIRGTGNIVSVAQMDSARIATLITSLLSEGSLPDAACPPPEPVSSPSTSWTELRAKPGLRRINITVNCGATIIGDRNIVGPGLGDIARQMQIAQRNAAIVAAQQKQREQQEQQNSSQRVPLMAQQRANLYQAQTYMGAQPPTPPMSRCSSFVSDTVAGAKRKAEDDAGEGLLLLKRRC